MAILFKNNHFSTIVKHKEFLYEFVTDEGIVDADPQITWQTLTQISGDEQFVNNKFQSIHSNLSQHTQIAQYNRLKLQQDSGGSPTSPNPDESCKTPPDPLIDKVNAALEYIGGESFERERKKREEEEALDPLVDYGLSQRTTSTVDPWIGKDYVRGFHLLNRKCGGLELVVRGMETSDAQSLYHLLSHSHSADSVHYKNIEWMHSDDRFGIVVEAANEPLPLCAQHQHRKRRGQRLKIRGAVQMSDRLVIGVIKYQWLRFNYWEWRESEWEDFAADNIHSSFGSNRFERQRAKRAAGVRTDSFVNILDMAVLTEYIQKGIGTQLLMALIMAFPSGSRFGVEVPSDNTPAVKCFTKCGFTIARFENHGADSKYRMTMESEYTDHRFHQFMRFGEVTQPKVTDTFIAEEVVPLQVVEEASTPKVVNLFSAEEPSPLHDDGAHPVTPTSTKVADEVELNVLGSAIGSSSSGIQNVLCDMDPAQKMHIKVPYGGGVDEEDYHGETDPVEHQGHGGGGQLSGMSDGVGDFFGIGFDNNHLRGNSFLSDTLHDLGLSQYSGFFMDFGITKETLPHLDPSIVGCIIENEQHRQTFLEWLHRYQHPEEHGKVQVEQQPELPTDPPDADPVDVEMGMAHHDIDDTDDDPSPAVIL